MIPRRPLPDTLHWTHTAFKDVQFPLPRRREEREVTEAAGHLAPRVETLYKKTDAGLIGNPPWTRFYGQVQLPPNSAGPLRPTISTCKKLLLESSDQRVRNGT